MTEPPSQTPDFVFILGSVREEFPTQARLALPRWLPSRVLRHTVNHPLSSLQCDSVENNMAHFTGEQTVRRGGASLLVNMPSPLASSASL